MLTNEFNNINFDEKCSSEEIDDLSDHNECEINQTNMQSQSEMSDDGAKESILEKAEEAKPVK